MNRTASLLIATLLASIVGCASFSAPTPMRGADVSAPDRAPDAKAYGEKIPGVGQPQLIERTFVGQPPLVPHAVEKYVPLTMEENACLDCHITDELRGQKVPKIGQSHFSKTAQAQGRLAGCRDDPLPVRFVPCAAGRCQAAGGQQVRRRHQIRPFTPQPEKLS